MSDGDDGGGVPLLQLTLSDRVTILVIQETSIRVTAPSCRRDRRRLLVVVFQML